MRRWLMAVTLGLGLLIGQTDSVEAGVLGWPVVSQMSEIGKCLLTDAGKLVQIVITHATQATVEALIVARDCVDFVVRQATPLPDAPDHV